MPIRTRAQLKVSGMAFRPNENHMDIVNTNVAIAANRSVCHRARIRKKHHNPPITTTKLMSRECQWAYPNHLLTVLCIQGSKGNSVPISEYLAFVNPWMQDFAIAASEARHHEPGRLSPAMSSFQWRCRDVDQAHCKAQRQKPQACLHSITQRCEKR